MSQQQMAEPLGVYLNDHLTGAFGGAALARRMADTHTDGRRAADLRGLAQDFSSARNVGTVTTFVVNDVGIDIQVVGPQAQVTSLADETEAMIDSLSRTEGQS